MKKRQIKHTIAILAASTLALSCMTGCQGDTSLRYAMVCDTAQIKEDAFSWQSWNGLEAFAKEHTNVRTKYLESREEENILPNLEQLADEDYSLIWGIGEALSDPILESAKLNPDTDYILLDYAPVEAPVQKNIAYIDFRTEQAAFLAGYAAAYVTETNCVGFIGGKQLKAVEKFESGFTQGVDYAAKERGKEIEVKSIEIKTTYIGKFNDESFGSEAVDTLYEEGCDVFFHAAGQSGIGVIKAAELLDCWVIGADVDQYEVAPSVVLMSVLKNVQDAVLHLTTRYHKGEHIEGQTFVYGLEENGVGITEDNPNMDTFYPALYQKLTIAKDKIEKGEITVTSKSS